MTLFVAFKMLILKTAALQMQQDGIPLHYPSIRICKPNVLNTRICNPFIAFKMLIIKTTALQMQQDGYHTYMSSLAVILFIRIKF